MKKHFLCIVICTISLYACDKESDPIHYNCETRISLEEYKLLEESCLEAKLESIKEIEENLIGEWTLVGIKSGWVDTLFYECLALEIDSDKITIRNLDSGEETSSEWKIESWEVNVYTVIYLSTEQDGFNNNIGMETFSENYMYGTGRVDDGNSYLYEKVR